MKTNRVLPAALVAAVIAVGGVTHAMAETGEHDQRGLTMGSGTQMNQSVARDQGVSSPQPPKGVLTLNDAEQRAVERVGKGKIVTAESYGAGKDMYMFDIRTGDSTERVYVNGETGSISVIDASAIDASHEHNDKGYNS